MGRRAFDLVYLGGHATDGRTAISQSPSGACCQDVNRQQPAKLRTGVAHIILSRGHGSDFGLECIHRRQNRCRGKVLRTCRPANHRTRINHPMVVFRAVAGGRV